MIYFPIAFVILPANFYAGLQEHAPDKTNFSGRDGPIAEANRMSYDTESLRVNHNGCFHEDRESGIPRIVKISYTERIVWSEQSCRERMIFSYFCGRFSFITCGICFWI